MGFFCFPGRKNNNEVNESSINMENANYKNTKMMIHICGLWQEEENEIIYKKVKDNIKDEIDLDTIDKDRDFKEYESTLLTPEICKKIEQNIGQDKASELGIINHTLLCFGDNDMDMVLNEFSLVHRPRIILITKEEIKVNKEGKKYITIIIRKGMSNEELKDTILSSLNEIYWYYNGLNDNRESNDNNFPLKILLTGLRLSGKSTFVNLFSNKLLAYVTNDSESGTLKTSEYNIKINGIQKGIKLIDTPGMCSKKKINGRIINEIKKYIKEEKIDFILFFYNESNYLGEGKSLLKLLDMSKIPVFIIANNSKIRENNTKNQDIKSKISYLKQIGCQRLSNNEYFIEVNLKSNSNEKFFGMESIFNKMEKIEMNKINKDNKIIESKNETNKSDNIMDIIKYYKNKTDWDKDEVEIIRK